MQESDNPKRRSDGEAAQSSGDLDPESRPDRPSSQTPTTPPEKLEIIAIIEHLGPYAHLCASIAMYADKHEAEDVAQEGLMILAQLLDNGHQPIVPPDDQQAPFWHFQPWIKEIIRRVSLRFSRNISRRPESLTETIEAENWQDEPPKVEQRDEIMFALSQLPDDQQQSIIGRYWLGETNQETADRLGVSHANTISHIRMRAQQRLRDALAGEYAK